jgi:hypothetical protein
LASLEGHRRGRVADHERPQALGLTDGVLGGEHPAPGLPEQVVAVRDAERFEQVVQLVHEEVDGPEVGALVGQVRRAPRSQLVVVDNGPTLVGQGGDSHDVVVGAARSPVGDDQGRLC